VGTTGGLEEELKRQQHLDTLRLEFATKSRNMITHIEDLEDSLSEPVKSFSIAAIEVVQQNFSQFLKDYKKHKVELDALTELNHKMESEGIKNNMYSQFTLHQVTERWGRLHQEVEDKKAAIEKEVERQSFNESLCKEFASKAKACLQWCNEQKEEVSKVSGTIQQQLDTLRAKVTYIANNKSSVEEVTDLARKIDEANITHNTHTDVTIETVALTFENLGEFISKQMGLLEAELLKQSGSKVSAEQLEEFKQTFKQFDKDSNGTLEKHEFKACLSALGHFSTDQQVETLVKNIGKKQPGTILFEEFVEYMISKTEDSDTPASINNAFKTIASDRDTVSEDELKRFMDADTVEYLKKHMPQDANGHYSYKAFTENTYHNA